MKIVTLLLVLTLSGCVGYNPSRLQTVCWQQLLYSGSMYMNVGCNPGSSYVVNNYPNNIDGIYVNVQEDRPPFIIIDDGEIE